MTKIKLCGLRRICDVEAANELKPEYVGFVFAPKSRRYVSVGEAERLRSVLHSEIQAVGVFVDEKIETVAKFLETGLIDVAQLHGSETEKYIAQLRTYTDRPIIKAFQIDTEQDADKAQRSSADFVLLDSGKGGTGTVFDWKLAQSIHRPYFLAGGLGIGNVEKAARTLVPYAVDVSSGIETDGQKDQNKMAAFVAAVRKEEKK